MVLAGCRSDTLICLELLLYSDGETSWSWNSGRGDGSWHSGYADWKNVPSRPNQMRLWMCTTCGHHNSSKAACSQCGVRSSWAEVVKGVQQTNSATPPSLPNEEIKALEAALAAPPDNVDLCGKVRAPLEGEASTRSQKKARDSKPLDQRLEGCRGALQRASKAKQAAIAQQQAAQEAFEEAEADESRIREERAREAGTFANRPANMLTDHILQSSTTQRCGDRTFPSHASVRSICNTDCSRRSPLPHCPSSGESITCRGGRYRNTCLGLRRRRFGHGHTRRRSSRNSQTRHRKRRARNVPCGQTSNQIENRCRSAGGGSCG